MAAHSESRPTSPVTPASREAARTSWNPYETKAEVQLQDVAETGSGEREAMPPPESPSSGERVAQASDGQNASSVSSSQTNEILEALSTLTDKVKDGVTKDAILDTVKRFAKSMQQTVSKLGGVAGSDRRSESRTSDVAIGRFSMPARDSLSNSLDGYRPDRDVVAPISVRPNAMELLWVCGDCGQHYPRARECPEECNGCGAPKQHFYAPIED